MGENDQKWEFIWNGILDNPTFNNKDIDNLGQSIQEWTEFNFFRSYIVRLNIYGLCHLLCYLKTCFRSTNPRLEKKLH